MMDPKKSPYALRVAELAQSRATGFDITLTPQELADLRDDLGLSDLRKLRFVGEVAPLGKRDWQLTAQLGATVEQPCVATLAPVRTRIDTSAQRRFLAEYDDPDDPEAEMPEDDDTEALGSVIDPGEVLREALSLALPLYPRADDTGPVELQVTEPGQTPMSDEDAKPFAGLAALRDKLQHGNSD